MRQPQYLTDLPHRHSHPGHRLPLWFFTGTADLLIRMSMGGLAKRSSETVRNHRIAVRLALESVSAFHWISHPQTAIHCHLLFGDPSQPLIC
jgi:hypothetical protein